MGWLEVFCLLAIVTYSVFMLGNIFTIFPRKNNSAVPAEYAPQLNATIIIPARNEEAAIVSCLQSIALQDFPKEQMEIIVVNDHSEDKTADLAIAFLREHFPHHKFLNLNENEQGKKTAISIALEQSFTPVVITRDADTVTRNTRWLKEIIFRFESSNCDLLISPVVLTGENNFIVAFQKFENLATMFLGLSMAQNQLPLLCSGANLAYKKDIFSKLDPYRDNLQIASGDDMFLLKAAFSNKCAIRPNTSAGALVYTPAEEKLPKALSQRLRWASKTGKIANLPVFSTGLILLFGNIAALIALVWPFFDSFYLPFCLFTLTLKLIIDFLLLFLSARMLNQKVSFTWYLPAFVFNLMYTPVIALGSLFIKSNWKGRSA